MKPNVNLKTNKAARKGKIMAQMLQKKTERMVAQNQRTHSSGDIWWISSENFPKSPFTYKGLTTSQLLADCSP
ncbi:hypothetical protein E2C01_049134 [Portunus trituberculatus]|uniref:Uncharacterized protein n=1 Tax=Portunus trituberculatus TaxID=210409 RepID=A0A5B7GD44_PORTR|nr:hypothetical protein [Portunus trituberculatus]